MTVGDINASAYSYATNSRTITLQVYLFYSLHFWNYVLSSLQVVAPFVTNLEHFLAGRPLKFIVDWNKGY